MQVREVLPVSAVLRGGRCVRVCMFVLGVLCVVFMGFHSLCVGVVYVWNLSLGLTWLVLYVWCDSSGYCVLCFSNFFVVCMFGVMGCHVCPVCPASVMVCCMDDICLCGGGASFFFMECTPRLCLGI